MAEPRPVPVTLYWGENPFLLRLAATEYLASVGIHAREVDAAREWQGGETTDLATPSLWGERRALLITNSQALPEAGLHEVRGYVGAPAPDALLVMTLVSKARSQPKLVKAVADGGGVVRAVALKRQDLPRWVMERGRVRQVRIAAPAAAALVGTLGEDAGVLDQAVEQLASAFPGIAIGLEQIRSQFRGLGEQRVWDLCDQALTGRLPEALVTLRSLFEGKDDPLMMLGGVASRLRDLLRVRSLPDELSPAEVAKRAGLRFDWQARRYREQARRFSIEELTALHARVVQADRALKGGAPGDVIMPALVAAMAGHAEAALDIDVRVSR